jgi:endonuclease/exonuclease/phosphatase family metal-dependent hydrolase
MKKLLKVIFYIFVIAILGFCGLIIYAMISDYKPKEKEIVYQSDKADKLKDSMRISILTWNIGYCGLDKEMDFFYDGGEKVFTTKPKCIENLAKITKFIKQNDSVDFIFIQEIDKGSKRSYYINEYDSLSNSMKDFSPYFGKNYDVFFVPVPPKSPMGKVLSGIAILSKFRPSESIRYAFPGEYGFPKQLFMLDRCFLANRYTLKNGKELVIINTHNEAFDPGEIRKAQMAYLKNFLLSEYKKGNYLIVGGDWNQCPPAFKAEFPANKLDTIDKMDIPVDFLPSEWKWLFDNKTPTNRRVVTKYDPATTLTTVIDFFLVSPNIEAVSVKGIQLNFENTDHNPVIVQLKLK